MAKLSKAEQVYRERVTEQYILSQVNYFFDSESFSDHKRAMEDGDRLYMGDLAGLFPDETSLPAKSLVENKFKNALHDISRLASEGRGMVKFVQRGDTNKAMKQARVSESINEGYWVINKMRQHERKLYLDIAGSGVMAAALYYDERSPYPQANLLNPRFCYPDVRGGKLQSLLSVESVMERVLAREFPSLGLDPSADNATQATFVCYYDEEGVSEAVVLQNSAGRMHEAKVTKQWAHGLGCVPVAYEQLDTYDGKFHGLF